MCQPNLLEPIDIMVYTEREREREREQTCTISALHVPDHMAWI
jgi:hypothetical protein